MSKKVLAGIGVVVLLLIIVVWQLLANLDSIVAGVIEKTGSETLGTEVSVSGVSIHLKEGKAGIAGLTIANPEGYSTAKLFEMEGIEVELDIQSLGKDVLVIESIRIQNPQISFEADASGSSNMQTILDNMGTPAQEESKSSDTEPFKMIVDRFEFSGGQVKASTVASPGEVAELKLPPINMSGIGHSQGGVTADVVAEKITKELVNGVIEAAVRAGLNKELEKQKKGLMDKLTDKLKGDG
jgi:hypothetical protein